MPIRPQPFTFTCSGCGWKKTVAPHSDALGPGDWFSRCPKCGNEALTMAPASALEKLKAQWLPWY